MNDLSSSKLESQPDIGWNLDSSYSQLPTVLFEKCQPESFSAPEIQLINHGFAAELGIDTQKLSEADAAQLFSGQCLPPGSVPLAQAYAGHQFGGFTMLGDGRAILMGEQKTPNGERFDIQFKGSGQTPFSRRGDGRAALGPMVREYIISEGMKGLGIPTTRSLAVVSTGEPVYREKALPGAILTRVAASHIRVGTYQYLAARQDTETLQILADYTIARHFPEIVEVAEDKYLQFFLAVVERQASLIAKWQTVGFVHGVMNTDNMAISGETIDYGPCAFMDVYDVNTVFSSIDQMGRYAYGNQPSIAQWNLARFVETLLPLIDSDQDVAIERATDCLRSFNEIYNQHWLSAMRSKLGLRAENSNDADLIEELLDWMQAINADFTNTFDDLSSGEMLKGSIYEDTRFKSWYESWQNRLSTEQNTPASVSPFMLKTNPAIIPRNHRVEEALSAAETGDLVPVNQLLRALGKPFQRDEDTFSYRTAPPPGTCYRTFCGT